MASREILAKAYLFHGIDDTVLSKVASLASEATYAPGEYIYRRGDPGEAFYIITEGKVELLVDESGRMGYLAGHVSAGGHFGEVGLLTGNPRFYSVRALTQVRLVVFARHVFETELLANQDIHRIFDKSLAERLALASLLIPSGSTRNTGLGGQDMPSRPFHLDVFSSFPFQESLYEDLEFARKLKIRITSFAAHTDPILITGEVGSGRRLIAQQIHLAGAERLSPYVELDIRQFDPWLWDGKLFGYHGDAFPFSTGRKLGMFEQMQGGTVVLHNAELLSHGVQAKLANAIKKKAFKPVGGEDEHPLRTRLILTSSRTRGELGDNGIFSLEFLSLFDTEHIFPIPPLRERKRDLPALAQYYLRHYAKEYGKKVTHISPEALGLLINYDWPGNLAELASVIQRAVIASQEDKILSEQILLGLPRSEGKMVYNLLRFPKVRRFITHGFFPDLPRFVTMLSFFLGLVVLFFGPQDPEKNIGITWSWFVGWPLLVISFFFLPRLWCSVCALSAPGAFMQRIFPPKRRVPVVIVNYSGWIMAFLCLAVFWVEIVWNAYASPILTAGIMLTIASGSLICSLLFKRYAWCRYLCPLGALNGIFSMPSVLELRANRQLCDNQCEDHACYRGTEKYPGCPMFRHPFLVDNNRDCILCGRCIKNCKLQSIQLNLRFAPHELWMIQTPRVADSFLVIGLAAVFFPLARHENFLGLADLWLPSWQDHQADSVLFWGLITFFWMCYWAITRVVAAVNHASPLATRAAFGYGLLPLVLGGYLAVYVRLFLNNVWRLAPNLLLLFGIDYPMTPLRLVSEDGMTTLLHLILLGGLVCSLYAVRKIVARLVAGRPSFAGVVTAQGAVFLLGFLYLRYI